jgi:hypothetical protein
VKWVRTEYFTIMASKAWMEGRVAFFEDRPDSDNPYLNEYERSQLKDDWNTDARDWDDGWCEAKTEEDADT